VNTRFLARAAIAVLAAAAVLLTLLSFLIPRVLPQLVRIGPPLGPTPRPPTLDAPRGQTPAGSVGVQEWSQYAGQPYRLVGSGFFLWLGDDAVVGVTTAHSVSSLGLPGHALERIAFALPGQSGFVAELDTLYGPPGIPLTWNDLSVDYVLLKVGAPIDPALVLTADPRGMPQPGERVMMFSGLGDEGGNPRPLAGTVMAAEAAGIWALMDETFDAGRMSGSPLLSAHTGQVVGMAIAVAPRGDRLLIGFHPIGHIVELAASAGEFPKIAGYRKP
jgi:hypothetical protein